MLIYQLLRPVTGYLSIRHPTKKYVDWVFPVGLVLVTLFFIFLMKDKVNIFGVGGVITLVLGYIQNLPGFYIAALAAIATFARTDIDVLMPGNPPPQIRSEDNRGIINLITLTRRRFLCLLFAFLTAECIFLTFLSIFFVSIAPGIKIYLSNEILSSITFYLAAGFYLLFLYQLLITTLWGLYYLGERIHQIDQ